MSDTLASRAGSALVWRAVQLGGIKLIFLARLLVLARLLSPEDFGLFAICAVAVDFLLSLTNMGMIPALVQHPAPDRSHYDAAWTVSLVRALAIAATVFVSAPFIAGLFAEPRAVDLLRLLAFRPILQAAASIRVADLVRHLRFRSIASLRLWEGLANTILSIALAPWLGVWALVAGPLVGSTVYLVLSYVLAPHRPRLSFESTAVRPLVRFGRWIFVTGVVAVAGSSVLQLAISRRLGVVELGLYFLAASLAFLPGEVTSGLVGSVAFPIYARVRRDTTWSTRAFRSMLVGTAAIIVPTTILLLVLAPRVVQDVLGARWAGTEPLIRLLVCLNIIGLLGETIVPVLKGVGQPHRVAILEFVQSLILVVLVWDLAGRFGVIGAALAWIPAIAASQLLAVGFLRTILPHPFAGMGRAALAVTVAAGLGGISAAGLAWLVPGFPGLVTAVGLAAAAVVSVLWLMDRRMKLGLAAGLARAFPQAGTLLGTARSEIG